jgi:hypothetical protein
MIHFTNHEGWEEGRGRENLYVPKHANIFIPIIPPWQCGGEEGGVCFSSIVIHFMYNIYTAVGVYSLIF